MLAATHVHSVPVLYKVEKNRTMSMKTWELATYQTFNSLKDLEWKEAKILDLGLCSQLQ